MPLKVLIRTPLFRRLFLLALLCLLIAVLLIIAAVFYGWSQAASKLPELSPWHRDFPRSEFTAGDETDASDFGDYLAIEDAVFKELEKLEKGRWADAASGPFNRFRPGSPSHPTTLFEQNWNRSFLHEADEPSGGILMVHGLSDSPYSCRALGQRFRTEGFTVMGLRVPGHGTCPGALAHVKWQDWTAAVRIAAKDLRRRLPPDVPLLLLGYSNGAALCVDYAATALDDPDLPQPGGLVLLSPMIGISPTAKITRYHNWIAAVSGEERAHWSSIGAPVDPYKYSSWPMNASVQAWKITRRLDRTLARLAKQDRMGEFPPLLTCQSAIDATVTVSNLIEGLFGRLRSPGSELLVFDVNHANWLDDLVRLDFEAALLPALSQNDGPYRVTLVTNAEGDSRQVKAITRNGDTRSESPIAASWPLEVFSLSHIALPFPMDDPIYGIAGVEDGSRLPLGNLSFRGESGMLLMSDSQILRLRHNPFYSFMEQHIVEWTEQLGKSAPPASGP